MWLQAGVITYNSDVRERFSQLSARGFPAKSNSRCLTFWTAQALPWFIPELDAGLVQVQSQDWATMWDLSLQEMVPLPHGCCLGCRKMVQNGFRFLTSLCHQNIHMDPFWGPRCGPQNGPNGGPPFQKNESCSTDLGLHRCLRQEILGRQTAEA